MNEAEFEQLKARVSELEAWKAARERQQLIFPLDPETIKILNKDFMRLEDEYVYIGDAAGNTFKVLVGTQNGVQFDVYPGFTRYTALASSDVVTILDANNGRFANDDQIVLYTTDTAPGGLSAEGGTTYHVINAASDGRSFKLSTTEGGSAVNITDAGTGRQYLDRVI